MSMIAAEAAPHSRGIAASTVRLSSLQKTSDEAEWVDLVDLPPARLLVRALDYTPYQIARDMLIQRFSRKHGRKPIPRKELIPAIGRLYAEHILMGWDGFDIEYSEEAAGTRLGDWTWRQLVNQIEWAAGTLSDVNAEFVEDAAGNSEPLSAGILSG